MRTLCNLNIDEIGTIKDIHSDDIQQVKRLHAMGVRHGAKVKLIRRGLTGSPLHVRIATTELAIRQKDAENIHIF